jgi:hypothetical protein
MRGTAGNNPVLRVLPQQTEGESPAFSTVCKTAPILLSEFEAELSLERRPKRDERQDARNNATGRP